MLMQHLGDLEQRLIGLGWALPQAEPTALRDLLEREFSRPLLGAGLTLERGRIVDSLSRPGTSPVQCDAVLYRHDGPRLQRPGEPMLLLAESVVATLDLVRCIDLPGLARSAAAARAIKTLRRGTGEADAEASRLAIRCHVVAWDSPPQMELVHHWLKHAYKDCGIVEPDLPDTGIERERVASPALDGVCVLGRGFLSFDNIDLGFVDDEGREAAFGACWLIGTAPCSALAVLYLQLQQAVAESSGQSFTAREDLKNFEVSQMRFGN